MSLRCPKPIRRRAVAVFFAVLTIVGMGTGLFYGQPWDEVSEQDILRMNLNQYAAVLQIDFTCEGKSRLVWPQDGLIANSVERDHGESAYYPLFWLVCDTALTDAQHMAAWHAYTWLWFMAGVASLWLIARRIGLSRWGSCVAALLLVLTPRMFAEGHYNNKDMVLLSLVLLAVWLAMRWMDAPTSWRRALCFSFVGAMAANTKIIGLMVWGLCLLAVLVAQVAARRLRGKVWLAGGAALLGFVLCYVLLTPALWSDPAGYIQYVLGNTADFTRWKNHVLFRGAVFNTGVNPLPFYYLPYMILVTTPLWLLGLIALGQILAVVRVWKNRKALGTDPLAVPLLLCTGLWLLPFMYVLVAGPTLYNGWRHMYFIYGPLLVLAVYGLHASWSRLAELRKPALKKTVAASLLALCMAFNAGQIAASFPNEYAFFNLLVAHRDLSDFLELDYWNVSTLQTVRAMLAKLDAGECVTIAAAEPRTQQGLEAAWDLLSAAQQNQLIILAAGNPNAQYVITNTAHALIWSWQPETDMMEVAATFSAGQRLCTVYRQME